MSASQRPLPTDRFGAAAQVAGSLAFELAQKWWMFLIRGILLIIIGILAFTNPGTWVIFAGVYLLIDGLSMLFAGFGDQPAGQSRWPLIIVGILGLVAGLLILWNPEAAGLTLTWIIAAWAVIGGILLIISAIALREEISNEWWMIIGGILAIIFGILVFTNAAAGFLAIEMVFAIFAIASGIASIFLSFRVRDFGKEIGAVT